MKIILTPNDQAVAIQAYLIDNYNITTYIDEEALQDMEIDVPPTWAEPGAKLTAPTVDKERDAAIERADELGISYHPNIGTENLIKRIEEHELEMEVAIKEPDPLPTDEKIPQEKSDEVTEQTSDPLPDIEEVEEVEEEEEPKQTGLFPKRNSIFGQPK